MLPESITVEAVLTDLPQKIRIHALAKRLGMASKELIAVLAERDITVKSAQSSLTAEEATNFVTSFLANTGKTEEAEKAETVADDASETTVPSTTPAADDTHSASSPFINPFAVVHQAEPMTATLPQNPFATDVVVDPFAVNARLQETAPIVVTAQDMGHAATENDAETDVEAAADTDADSADARDHNGNSQNGDSDGQSSRRRRRRGRRGRGRGRGDDTDTTEDTTGSTDNTANDDDDNAHGSQKTSDKSAKNGRSGSKKNDVSAVDENDDDEEALSTHRRRRRRRRNDVTSDDTQNDPPNTVVHERGTTRRRRNSSANGSSDEVQGISGSTRLEAKRQRRREGRDNARHHIPVLSEAEFLARRESVERTMVVREKERSDHPGITTQVGVLEDNILVEHFVTSDSQASMVGNIYLGRVQNVLPSMEAAFIDIGRGRNAVLYAGEVNWAAAGLGGKSRKIELALSPGDMVLVQVSKDPIAHKGARLTTQISMAGRYLVYVPDGGSTGISRKLPDTERKRLKGILRNIVPGDAGVIIRTAAEGASEEDFKRDIDMLHNQWLEVQQAAEEAQQKADGKARTLHEEPTLLVKVVRDLFNDDFTKLVVEGERAWSTITEYVQKVAPQLQDRLEQWENTGVDVFQAYRIDEQLAKALDRKVWLPSGGTLVIDRTEAMTVIDVNTGKFTGSGGDLEETVTRNNLEAAEEIVRQLRLRDIGGIIIVDFIDMVLESNRDLVLRRLREALGRDRTRHQVSEVTSLGLIQLTRKRLGTGLLEAFSKPCPHCSGTGYILQEDPVEAITNGANAEDLRAGRRRRGRNSDKQEKNDHSKNGKSKDKPSTSSADTDGKNAHGGKDRQGPDPSEHPMMKAMGRKKAAATAADQVASHTDSEEKTAEIIVDTSATVKETSVEDSPRSEESGKKDTDKKDTAEQHTKPRRRRRGRRHGSRNDQNSKQNSAKSEGKNTTKDVSANTQNAGAQSTAQGTAPASTAPSSAPRKRRGARRATQAAGTVTPRKNSVPAERKEVVSGVLAAAPVAVNTSTTEKKPRRARRRATRSSASV